MNIMMKWNPGKKGCTHVGWGGLEGVGGIGGTLE